MVKFQPKSIAIIRALDLRIIQGEYAATFKRIEPFFVSNYNREIKNLLKSKKTNYIDLKLTQPYLFDPIRLFFKRTSHQSWLAFDNKSLEKTLLPIDFLQIQEPFFLYSGQVADIAQKYNKPLIMAPFMCFNHLSSYIPPYSLSVRRAIDQTDLFIMRTERVSNYLSQFKIPNRKKVLIYHGINTKCFFPRKKDRGGKIRILFVGVLDSNKGLDDILDVFPKLVKLSRRDIELVICGKGVLEKKVLNMAKTLPINYMGYVSNLSLPEVYRDCDIFCGPSKDEYFLGLKLWEEGFGFVFIEAMASGLPVVTNDCGAIREVVGEDNYINEQDDKNALQKSLLELINDPKLRRSVGLRNRDKAEKFFNLEKQVIREENEIIRRFI
ncbi:hypothetical protein A2V56_00715 [Candidatus Woesebacteria bacterium RBG_19FT_COMBO_42_9]|uniref:Glycosyl transferase family 1 domain-containing protein n=1 Tax=Candidatus Woesebacteria bacterium RBG_16_42_24 TaxID=1802485 RepID=A0A1F7XMF8_9BACT|nr:MAG: hypothetical protein A2V97_00575 [Candidatus Woesebacteria bacterium RBG_16_42_24]OGM16557.1 MAG: hypothetical protein A2V56_00715 [Candidatus Woesebacteria bacterium RBG_19FT_COMBO_42_9]